ncbi:MAG: DUF2007 domain-containing protein [Candidatus Pacebacteria bacterium]|nr:DUF2007 domain-containing protein [Candidatus Paceibacterota bacterium]
MITIASFDNTEEAELLRIRLEQEGITAHIADAAVVTLNWMYSNAVGGVKVQVAEQDLAKAKNVLDKLEIGIADQYPLSKYKCPYCGSTKVECSRISKRFFMLSLLVLGIPLAFYHPQCHCLDCCKTWKQGKTQRLKAL